MTNKQQPKAKKKAPKKGTNLHKSKISKKAECANRMALVLAFWLAFEDVHSAEAEFLKSNYSYIFILLCEYYLLPLLTRSATDPTNIPKKFKCLEFASVQFRAWLSNIKSKHPQVSHFVDSIEAIYRDIENCFERTKEPARKNAKNVDRQQPRFVLTTHVSKENYPAFLLSRLKGIVDNLLKISNYLKDRKTPSHEECDTILYWLNNVKTKEGEQVNDLSNYITKELGIKDDNKDLYSQQQRRQTPNSKTRQAGPPPPPSPHSLSLHPSPRNSPLPSQTFGNDDFCEEFYDLPDALDEQPLQQEYTSVPSSESPETLDHPNQQSNIAHQEESHAGADSNIEVLSLSPWPPSPPNSPLPPLVAADFFAGSSYEFSLGALEQPTLQQTRGHSSTSSTQTQETFYEAIPLNTLLFNNGAYECYDEHTYDPPFFGTEYDSSL
eukprot:TRINITY_DN1110_c0_g1_i1.p1 TRINITY_DN1110_c0_g1~~TRINITY_DN1110_c0_g1_i1.p1  ORF type:complete len:438 (-),score=74.97 TRINITY_DN1110_c0_g1_i1:552-1865(-)